MLYKSYPFRRRDPILESTEDMVDATGLTIAEIHRRSGVASTTMHNWFNGKTISPRFCTIAAVGSVCGHQLIWSRKPGRPRRQS